MTFCPSNERGRGRTDYLAGLFSYHTGTDGRQPDTYWLTAGILYLGPGVEDVYLGVHGPRAAQMAQLGAILLSS